MQMIGLTSSTADHGGSILEPVVKVAIRNVHHMDSSKMFIRTQTKFWKVDPTIPQNIQMDELPRGVYSYALYYQFLSVLDPAHDRGVYLAGDSVSWSGGWIEGALQTGINAACAAAKRIGASMRPHSPLTQNLHRYNYGSIAR